MIVYEHASWVVRPGTPVVRGAGEPPALLGRWSSGSAVFEQDPPKRANEHVQGHGEDPVLDLVTVLGPFFALRRKVVPVGVPKGDPVGGSIIREHGVGVILRDAPRHVTLGSA